METKKALRKAFKIIAAVLILTAVCVGTFLAYTWFASRRARTKYIIGTVYI